MGYQDRNLLALDDLNKLILYKTRRNISDTWVLKALGYYIAFQRSVNKEELEDAVKILMYRNNLEGRIDLKDVPKKSVRASNIFIIAELGITHRMAENLQLMTLREDASRIRKLKWNRTKESLPRSVYLNRFETNKKAMKKEIELLMTKGRNKTEIARDLGISRQTVYTILKDEDKK